MNYKIKLHIVSFLCYVICTYVINRLPIAIEYQLHFLKVSSFINFVTVFFIVVYMSYKNAGINIFDLLSSYGEQEENNDSHTVPEN